MRNYICLLLACAALVLSACSGSATIERDSSKQGDDFCRISSDVIKVGCPGVVRCTAAADPGTIEIESWSWGVSNGRILRSSDDGSEVWISIDEPGVCTLTARGVDKDGKDCTTPKHKLHCAKGQNAAPVIIVPAEPMDSPFFKTTSDGKRLPYHEWAWRCICYDPDDPTYECYGELEITGGDLDGDGRGDVLCYLDSDGKRVVAGDWDADGVDDDCDGFTNLTHSSEHTFVVRCPSKSKEDVYVWKVKEKKKESTEGKKEYVGHVSLLK
jgi:hypothetical protein